MDEYDTPEGLLYTADHEWARPEEDRLVVGITDFAQKELGDVVFVELPSVGTTLEKGEPFGVIESVKAVSDLYAPASGEVLEVNDELSDRPEAVNEDCYGDGWIVAIALDDPAECEALLDAKAYLQHIRETKG